MFGVLTIYCKMLTNTVFEQANAGKVTWVSPDGVIANETDYILVQRNSKAN